jgi:arylamine N-acetyltransferase
VDTDAFLRRLGLAGHDKPSVESLFRLHAAFVEAVPYETVQYQLGGGGPLYPLEVAERIISRQAGGYCFQLNGAFAALLAALGYQVTMHRGGVQTRSRPAQVDSSHLVLTVTGLPDAPDVEWFVDAGLGDGLHLPLPLQAGTYDQKPYGLRLRPSEITAGWRLEHDPRSSMIGMDFESAPATLEDFAAQHAYLATAPDSPFVRVCSAFRRRPRSVDILRSLTLTEVHADRVDSTVLQSRDDFYAALRDVFDLPLWHLSADDRDRLWGRAVAQYEAFLARAALPGAAEQSAMALGR